MSTGLTRTQRSLIEEVSRRNELARRATFQPGQKLTRPRKSHQGKPHGPAERIRWRCLGCGMLINDKARTTWVQKPQVFDVRFGGRRPGGSGIITYTEIEDPRYMPAMEAMFKKMAKQLGYTVKRGR